MYLERIANTEKWPTSGLRPLQGACTFAQVHAIV